MNKIQVNPWRIFLILFPAVFLFTSCREDEPKPVFGAPAITNEANKYVNSWIYETMEYWYLWNDELPTSPDKNEDPETYFSGLLHDDDRFSWIQENYRELLNSLQGISREAGYEFVLYREKEGSDQVLMQVLYVKHKSPAANGGLKRGDAITHVNGQRLTTQNYREVLSSLDKGHTIQYKPLLVEEQKFGDIQTLTLSTVEYAENPNYLHTVVETAGKRIGYFVYNFFAPGTESQPGLYDAETNAIFAEFKSKGITDLVLDLRFNSGGSESSAKKLASLIGRGIDQNTIFLKRQYNKILEEEILNDESLGESFLVSNFTAEENNIGNLLGSGRVYILTSAKTASASELLINALKPFMDVFLIGDTTYGKNVGSVSLFEENDPKNSWGLQPIVVKVYNSLGQSDYSNGFSPNVLHKDNGLYLYPLGHPQEALLNQAIAQITGTATTARSSAEKRIPVGHSLDLKRRSFNLTMDEIKLRITNDE